MEELIEQYLGVLQDSNECLKLYATHIAERDALIKSLREELKEQEARLNLFMARDSFTISRSQLRTFFVTVKYRHETDAEWDLFERTFAFKLQDEVYRWIESLPSKRESLPSSRESLPQEQIQESHISPVYTLLGELENASTLTAHRPADEESH